MKIILANPEPPLAGPARAQSLKWRAPLGQMCAACAIIGLMCEWRSVRGLWYPYDRTHHMLPIRDSKMNIIGATRWRSEGWARAGLEMLPPKHTKKRK